MKFFKASATIVIIAILALVVVGGGVWYFVDKSNETANWKTYTNEEYGFEIKHPKEYSANLVNAQSGAKDENGTKIVFLGNGWEISPNPLLTIQYNDNTRTNYISDPSIQLIKSDAITVDGINGTRDQFSGPYGNWTAIYLNKNGLIYSLVFGAELKNFNQILSTFKFVERDETADWQTYTNSKFSYKCPKDWSLGKNKNYGGLVDISECGISDPIDKFAFDNGMFVRFGFVSQDVLNADDNTKYAEIEWNMVKNEPNAQHYENNNFSGWVCASPSTKLIARYQVDNGFYEVQAMVVGNMGNGSIKTLNDAWQTIDEIISTFRAIK